MLVNTTANGGLRLIDILAEESRRRSTSGTYTLYAISCYFDAEAVRELVETVARVVRQGRASLAGCEIAIDVADWFRQRADQRKLSQHISRVAGLPEGSVRFHPVTVSGRLVHAKGYALISAPRGKAGKLRGFVAVTSGNLTKRGLGLEKASNIELAHVSDESDVLAAFHEQFLWLMESHPLRGKRRREHEEFLLALRLLGAGCFFHKWEGSLSSEISFRITLTEAGKQAARSGNPLFRDYEPSGDVRSRNPIDLASVFRRQPKPFPRHFWRTYSVETSLGRWVPLQIADYIDEVLTGKVAPYMAAVRKATRAAVLDRAAETLRGEVQEMIEEAWITQDETVVDKWLDRVKQFRDSEDLIRARIFNYERVPDVLDDAGRTLVLHTFWGMREHLFLKERQPGGLRGIMRRAIENELDDHDYEEELARIAREAREELERWANRASG